MSLPIRSNSDAMVKISSETVPAGKFYDRFFALMSNYLHTVPRGSPVPVGEFSVSLKKTSTGGASGMRGSG